MKETTKCYCGHTTTCDCGPEEPIKKSLLIDEIGHWSFPKQVRYSEEEVLYLLQKALRHQDDGEIGSLVTAQGKIRTANFYSWFEKSKKK